jgi:hypothetical protein
MLLAERDRLNDYFAAAPPMTILAVQDTTDLELTGKRASGKIGSLNYVNRKGYYVHSHLLFDTKGIGLGLFDQYMWNRQAEFFGQDRALWPLKDKESHRWLSHFLNLQTFFSAFPRHTVVDICDREGDFYEMFQARSAANVHLLIRSNKDKELASGKKLWSTLASQTASHIYTTKIADEKGKKHGLSIRVKFCPLTILANYRAGRDQPQQSNPVDLNGVLVEQVSPLQDWQKKPIVWRLLTTLPVEDFEQALQIIEYYIRRWRIEEFHYVLKQGCRIQDSQLKEAQSLENAITFYSLLAWKVLNLRYGASEQSHAPIQDFGFTAKDFLVLVTFLNHSGRAKLDPHKPCNGIGEFAKYAKLLATTSKSKGPPGVKSLWIGLEKLHFLIKAFEAFTLSKNL